MRHAVPDGSREPVIVLAPDAGGSPEIFSAREVSVQYAGEFGALRITGSFATRQRRADWLAHAGDPLILTCHAEGATSQLSWIGKPWPFIVTYWCSAGVQLLNPCDAAFRPHAIRTRSDRARHRCRLSARSACIQRRAIPCITRRARGCRGQLGLLVHGRGCGRQVCTSYRWPPCPPFAGTIDALGAS